MPLRDLERMSGDIAAWQARLSERSRYGVVQALRQTLGAAVRWAYMASNPALQAGRNRQPSPRTVRVYSRGELDAIGAELSPIHAPLSVFAAATGLRPSQPSNRFRAWSSAVVNSFCSASVRGRFVTLRERLQHATIAGLSFLLASAALV